jgi:hypothetical protein
VLVDEIGVEAGPELQRLHEAILRQDAATLDLPAAGPPPAAAPLISPQFGPRFGPRVA